MIKVILVYFLSLFLFGLLIFIPAGSLKFWNGWLFIDALLMPMFCIFYLPVKDSDLLVKRLKTKGKENTQNTHLILSIIVLSISCTNNTNEVKINRTEEIALIKEAIHGAIGWAKNKDFTVSNRIIANDSNYLEVDPGNKIVRGFIEFKKNEAFFADPRFKAIRYEIRDLKIDIAQSGTVAWYYCVLDDINEWEGQPACWMNTRWTGVLERRDGKWVIVQMHFSFAKE